jgi:hypothetical protein
MGSEAPARCHALGLRTSHLPRRPVLSTGNDSGPRVRDRPPHPKGRPHSPFEATRELSGIVKLPCRSAAALGGQSTLRIACRVRQPSQRALKSPSCHRLVLHRADPWRGPSKSSGCRARSSAPASRRASASQTLAQSAENGRNPATLAHRRLSATPPRTHRLLRRAVVPLPGSDSDGACDE